MEGRLLCWNTNNLFFYITRIHGHVVIKHNLTFGDLNALNLDNILVRIQLNVITQTNNRNHGTKFQRNLASNHNHAVQQVSALVDIRQRNNTVTELQLDWIYGQEGYHILRTTNLFRLGFLLCHFLLDGLLADGLGHGVSGNDERQTECQEQYPVQWREDTQENHNGTNDIKRLRQTEQLLDQKSGEVCLLGALGNQNTGG